MKEAVRGRYILTGDKAGTTIRDGAIIFSNGTIIDMGHFDAMQRKHHLERVHGSHNHVVLPGLVNAHHHGNGIHLLRVGRMDAPLERFIFSSAYVPDAKVGPICYENTVLAGLKMLKSGVTTTLHHYIYSEANSSGYLEMTSLCLQAYKDLGMRVAFAPGIKDRHQFAYVDDDSFISGLPAHAVDSLKRMGKVPAQYPTATQYFQAFDQLRNRHQSSRCRFLFGPSGPQWCSPQVLKEIRERSEKEDIGIHIHVLESPAQRKYGDREYAGGLIGYLEGLGLLNSRLTVAHGVQLTEEEIRKLARADCKLAHNPSSNLRLFNGVAPIREMLEEGLAVGIGTDNYSIDDDDDMFSEMRLCSVLQRPPRIDADPIPYSVLLNMTVANGAKITDFQGVTGQLEPGMKADLVLLDFQRIEEPFIGPDVDMLTVILNFANKSHVDKVFVEGECVLEHGRPTRIDEEELLGDIRRKYQLKGESLESKKLRQAINEELIRLYSSW